MPREAVVNIITRKIKVNITNSNIGGIILSASCKAANYSHLLNQSSVILKCSGVEVWNSFGVTSRLILLVAFLEV